VFFSGKTFEGIKNIVDRASESSILGDAVFPVLFGNFENLFMASGIIGGQTTAEVLAGDVSRVSKGAEQRQNSKKEL
jgi:hypothetical protein